MKFSAGWLSVVWSAFRLSEFGRTLQRELRRGRKRSAARRLQHIRLTDQDKWLLALMIVVLLIAMAIGGWLGFLNRYQHWLDDE